VVYGRYEEKEEKTAGIRQGRLPIMIPAVAV
jgi:hypothetical protein